MIFPTLYQIVRIPTLEAIFDTCLVTACVTLLGWAATLFVIVVNLPTILAFRHLRRARVLLCLGHDGTDPTHGEGPMHNVLLVLDIYIIWI